MLVDESGEEGVVVSAVVGQVNDKIFAPVIVGKMIQKSAFGQLFCSRKQINRVSLILLI